MLKEYLYEQILKYVASIDKEDIYVFSILVIDDEESIYKKTTHFPKVYINYNTEANCEHAPTFSEERWNIAFWNSTEEYAIIDPTDNIQGAEILLNWYVQNQILNIGYEDPNLMYDEDMRYIGKGPKGYWELFEELSLAIKEIRLNSDIKEKIADIPFIIHDYEYSWYITQFILKANPNNQARDFLNYYDNDFD